MVTHTLCKGESKGKNFSNEMEKEFGTAKAPRYIIRWLFWRKRIIIDLPCNGLKR
jgi:hypothetical protein